MKDETPEAPIQQFQTQWCMAKA